MYIASLLHKVQEKEQLSGQEQRDLDEWSGREGRWGLVEPLVDRNRFIAGLKELKEYDTASATRIIFDRLGLRRPHQMQHSNAARRWLSVAAIFLLALAMTWLFVGKRSSAPQTATYNKKDIAPGGNKAILTLSNGTKIILDSSQSGAIARQGAANVLKLKDGRLAYQPIDEKPTATVYNTLSTPRGGEYQLTLPDGSQVWLNAESSITYPVNFAGSERKVKITGEAYFEVVHNHSRPFRVQAGDQLIEDVGTAFNVNAYTDEPG